VLAGKQGDHGAAADEQLKDAGEVFSDVMSGALALRDAVAALHAALGDDLDDVFFDAQGMRRAMTYACPAARAL